MEPAVSLRKRALQGLAQFLVALWALVFLPAWSLRYWEGWVFWLEFSLIVTLITVYFLEKDPGLIERRLKAGPLAEKEKKQKIIQWFANFFFIALIIFPSIDHHPGWSYLSLPLIVLGDVLVALGFAIVFLVFRENSYTSGTIEVGKEQKVISTRPLPAGPPSDVRGSDSATSRPSSCTRVIMGIAHLRTHGLGNRLEANCRGEIPFQESSWLY